MAKTLAGVLAVSIAALLFAGCVTVEAPKAETTTTTTISKDQICDEIYKKIEEAIRRGAKAATEKFSAQSETEKILRENEYQSYLTQGQQLNLEFEAENCPIPTK
jgi:hypothetical protein